MRDCGGYDIIYTESNTEKLNGKEECGNDNKRAAEADKHEHTGEGESHMANGYMSRIKERVTSSEDGTIFAASDFADIADANTIRQSMYRLVNDSTLKRILQGVYEKPKYSKLLDEYVAADPDAVAKALARSYHWAIAPCGNTTLNLLKRISVMFP